MSSGSSKPLPSNADAKRLLWDQFKAESPELAAQVAELRKQFGGTVTALMVGGVQYGQPDDPEKVHTFTPEWAEEVRKRGAPTPLHILHSMAQEKKRIERAKRSRGTK